MTYKIGDLIRIYFYENVLGVKPANQNVQAAVLAIVITEEPDKEGYIQAEYLVSRLGVTIANLRPHMGHHDDYGRLITEIVSR